MEVDLGVGRVDLGVGRVDLGGGLRGGWGGT